MFQSWSDQLEGLIPHPALIIYFLIILPCALTTVSDSAVQNFEFPAYRLQQYDVAGSIYGSRQSAVNCEAAALATASKSLRKCLVVTWRDVVGSASNIDAIVNDNHGAVIIILPKSFDKLSSDQRKSIHATEKALISQSYQIPIYFVRESPMIVDVLQTLEKTQSATSALAALIDGIIANAYQIVSTSTPNPAPMSVMHNVVAKLETTPNAPTIVVVAYYDSFAMSPALGEGADSNASGVSALLELVRVLRKLYSTPSTRPQYNVVALLSAGGKFGYQGSRHFIENYWKNVNGGAKTDAGPIQFALCLDAISGDQLYLHVSKKPTPESNTGKFHQKINAAAAKIRNAAPKRPDSEDEDVVPIVAKKINLADTFRSWEHERFNMERLPAFTISSLNDPQHPQRRTMLDNWDPKTTQNIARNTQIIAESLVHYLYSTEPETAADVSTLSASVNEHAIDGWMERLTSKSRPAQSFSATKNAPNSAILKDMHAALTTLAHSTHYQTLAANNKDTDITVYTVPEATLSIYSVKPAVFDLVLGLAIVGYLALLYQCILNIDVVLSLLVTSSTSKQNGHHMSNGKVH